MENLPLLSVIVPVYKVEAYLDKCVQSIVDQTYTNLEIILVDDGSPDNCPAMCDAWAEKDSRIKVIHKENGGLSDARNAGMSIATGELMGFVDSDDWIDSEMYQLLYKNMQETGSDIAACGVEMVWEDGTPSRMLTKTGCCILEREEAMRAVIEGSWIQDPVWYKLYKTALVGDIPFPVGKYHEDVFWTYQAVGRAMRVSVTDRVGYYYLQHGGSIMGESYSLKRLDAVEGKMQRIRYVQDQYPDMVAEAKTDLVFFCLWSAQKAMRCLPKAEQEIGLKKLQAVLDGLGGAISRNFKECVWLAMIRVSLRGTARLRNLLHIGL